MRLAGCKCPRCRYDLKGVRSCHCPECGHAFDYNQVRFGEPKYQALPDIVWLVALVLQIWFVGLSFFFMAFLFAPLAGLVFYLLSVLSWVLPVGYELYSQWRWRVIDT